jgi:hypothetical protein
MVGIGFQPPNLLGAKPGIPIFRTLAILLFKWQGITPPLSTGH